LDGQAIELPAFVQELERGPDWLRVEVVKPDRENPALLACLMNQGLQVITLEEIPRSLEQIYLRAMSQPGDLQ
jgi:ABC-2 type transport system ATP-binding protein